ncbi:UbiA family prenyltransferase [Halostagnicola bangensis]
MNETSGNSRTVTSYATLVRVPNLFTAPPDIILGAAIAAGAGYSISIDGVVGLALASILLYAAGTTLNDYFDADEDARERPERPIPSGDVSKRQALVFGVVLLGSGVLLALVAAGFTSGLVAAVLALTILLYDGVFKGTSVGFLLMGGSRGLNVLLGSTLAVSPTALPPWAVVIVGTITLYIAAVTFLAESETGDTDSRSIPVAIGGMGAAVLGVLAVAVVRSPSPVEVALSIGLLGGFTAWTGRALFRAYTDPSPATIGPAIGTCVVALIVLNAAFAAIVGIRWSFAALVFLLPAMGLSRVFDVT